MKNSCVISIAKLRCVCKFIRKTKKSWNFKMFKIKMVILKVEKNANKDRKNYEVVSMELKTTLI